jgi:predicted lactoylglutathione lyase
MSPDFPAAIPEIPVSDLEAAAEYYAKRLGFEVDWKEEGIGLAGISKGQCRIFLADSEYRERNRNGWPVLTWLNLDSKEKVDDLHRQWKASGARLLSVPESKPHGLHEFTAADLDGNLFRVFYDFATPERA